MSRQERRLARALRLAGRPALATARRGCLGCALVMDCAARPQPAAAVREAAGYATSGALAGCLQCGRALDALCEAGLYSSKG